MDDIFNKGKIMIVVPFLAIALLFLVYFSFGVSKRNALDVCESLKDDKENQAISADDILAGKKEKKEVKLTGDKKVLLLILTLVFSLLSTVFLKFSLSNLIIIIVFSLSVSYIIVRVLANKDSKNENKRLDFYLPIVMERLVMAVQGGSDIYTAVNVIVKLSKEKGDELDPVTKILEDVINKTEAGIGFEEALNLVARGIKLTSLRHAFLHLAIAQKEGGEIIPPMEELSDSTQAYYQEVVENEIASLPVKATLPLLCSFLGLILFFLAVPLTQLMGMNTKL